ncbi:MAG: nitrogenase iron-molybdenum cofactor biosynthesis protein NifE [Thermodesulfovibrionales bacterium]|jgi:nitrogenase molybdenum-cofactor synthesis protein NifE|nr:nitrogenase iron-molybdenum cofactor biosynthesis protein NifE [Thermodesulfovibrionales bacterium]
MLTGIDKLMQSGCEREKKEKICRSRGGESCAFDGAMIVLQPIADAAHIVHGPIACCGNSWEGRGALSSKGNLHRMGFTTDMSEMDIIYGSEDRLYNAILRTYESVRPKAIFVYATCVSGLIGEDMEAVCKKAEAAIGIRVIPVNAPGFVGPKNLGNRIAGEVLLDYVVGTGDLPEGDIPDSTASLRFASKSGTVPLINLIGEYNIAGDLWLVEPVLKKAGIRVLSRITGDSTFEEITYAHKAKLNVVVCSRALINVAKEMERKYGIPYVEVSFFGKTEMSKAMRLIASNFKSQISNPKFAEKIEAIIEMEEKQLDEKLEAYQHLKGKRAVLYTGGVKSWSFISALMDLGIEIVAIGTKKSTFEDEEKMKEILGADAPLIEDITPKNLLRLMRERNADILVAGGRNQYLAIKEGFPFVDVNQERHTAYAGYEGLINLAEQISNSMRFYDIGKGQKAKGKRDDLRPSAFRPSPLAINPLKHSQSIGAAIAFQGIDRALPIIHGAQGCTFLGKVLLTKHFREPIALASTKLFTENVVMGSEENIMKTVNGFVEKNRPDVIGILTSGLSEVKGDDVSGIVKQLQTEHHQCNILNVSTPDYEAGLETGYAKAVEALLQFTVRGSRFTERQINVLVGSHLTPADFTEVREIIESFGLKPIMLPDLSALDGSRQGFSALAPGGTTMDDIRAMGSSGFTIAIGASMESAAMILKERFGIEYRVFEGISGLKDADMFMEALSMLSGKQVPAKYGRQRRVLIDGMRDAHFYYGGKRICLALENDLSLQMSNWLGEMGTAIEMVDVNSEDLFSIEGDFDLLISNSHAEDTAKRLGVPLYQMGFPVYKVLGNNHRVTIGYRGTLGLINDIANVLAGSQ